MSKKVGRNMKFSVPKIQGGVGLKVRHSLAIVII